MFESFHGCRIELISNSFLNRILYRSFAGPYIRMEEGQQLSLVEIKFFNYSKSCIHHAVILQAAKGVVERGR